MVTIKNIYKLGWLGLLCCCWMACLKKDLPGVSDSSLNGITDFNLVYKYLDTIVDKPGTPNESIRIQVTTIQLNKTLKISGDTVYVVPSFPVGVPQKQKVNITISNIWGVAYIPDAATIRSVGNAPALGKPGDYSTPATYEVAAANGNVKRWVVAVTALPAVNQWEGAYLESGTLDHSSAGLQTCPNGYVQTLVTVGPDKLLATAGYWYFQNPGITYFITIKTDNSVVISADPAATVVVQQDAVQPSSYDPVKKQFDLYYFYNSGGNAASWRKFHTILSLKQ